MRVLNMERNSCECAEQPFRLPIHSVKQAGDQEQVAEWMQSPEGRLVVKKGPDSQEGTKDEENSI